MMRCLLLLLFIVSGAVFAQDYTPTQTFDTFLDDIRQQATKRGISEQTQEQTLLGLTLNERVIQLDRKQPEFTQPFWLYLQQRVNDNRISKGRALYKQHRKLLDQMAEKYGVPGQFLIAFFGLETNFGQYIGIFPVVQSLATLAYDLRRRAFFTEQLLVVLELIDQNKIPADTLGSWAGAMGFTQFMPTNVKRYAIDFNRNGRLDLWSDLSDVFASSSHFLSKIGWQRGEKWGREVTLPSDFDYEQTGLRYKKTVNQWRQIGIKTATGGDLPQSDLQGSVVVPMGYKGPAFLVYQNFHAILNWNRSILYAISVGHLADRIVGLDSFVTPVVDEKKLSVDDVVLLQAKLNDMGFNAGEPDGIIGSKTRSAVKQYQIANQLPPDGYVGYDIFKQIVP